MAPTPTIELIHRGSEGYEEARRATCRNRHLPDRYAEVIVQATNEAEAAAAIRLAAENDWRVAIRSGGHSFSCNHIREGGMLLDLSRLNDVEIDGAAMTAAVGPGCRSDELDALLAERDLFFPVGHCQGVGLGGYLLQGGFGWNSRTLGMACESVLAIDYVDADGEVRHASPEENADVYWAARGSGPGFVGAITRYHLRLYPRPAFIGSRLGVYPLEKFEEVFRWVKEVGPTVSQHVELMWVVTRRLPITGEPGMMVIVAVFADSEEEARQEVSFVDSRPDGATMFLPFTEMSLAELTAETMSNYPEDHNHVVDNTWTHATADELLPAMRGILEDLPPAPSHFIWLNWSPKTQRSEMAFSLEDEFYTAQYGLWSEDDEHLEEPVTAWVNAGIAALAPHSSGIQLADENLARRDAPFMAEANRARLESIRQERDPGRRFHTYGSVAD
ncbi:FAD-binding oxidoreductase [Aeromicrobium wangtongii]|uniref:FAD-binding oxidoreductase n=1 Tax=Aeromicrobium wangtongii TaxID=2969247 RepID=UPI002017F068|nr:FAD-binding oxidoreductase [Aeromicrobium wangtongii]MCL3818282.1 FAD-binding oxidoreductase [Aeromicrobium wangtongii]